MQAVRTQNKTIELNKQAWSLRYVNQNAAINLAAEAKEIAAENDDMLNVSYARLTIAQLNFWKTANEDCLKDAVTALLYLEQLNDPLGISRAHFICAGMYDQYGQYEKAMHHAQHAVKIGNSIDNKDNLADCYTVLGQIYSRIHDYSQAVKALKQGLELRRELKDDKAAASSLNLIGRNFVLSKKYKEAADFYKESLVLRKSIGDTAGIPWTYLGLASLFSEKGEWETSLEYYALAEKANVSEEKRFELLCQIGKGSIYLKQSNTIAAIEYLSSALENAAALKIISLTSEAHQLLAAAYEKGNDPAKALYHYKCFNEMQQEILSSEKVNMLKHQQIAFSVENAEKEAEIHRLKNIELKNAFDKIAIQHHELEVKNREILDSIDYAKYIQDAYFPSKELFKKIMPNAFLLFKPKDILSGDFYWFHIFDSIVGAASENKNHIPETSQSLLFAAADCTGHGVPGAIMSVICCNAMNDVIQKNIVRQPHLILDEVRKIVIGAFERQENTGRTKDGMDIALIGLTPFPTHSSEKIKLQYSGANNPLWVIRKGIPPAESINIIASGGYYLIEIKGDKQPVGYYEKMTLFTLHEMDLFKDDTIYSFSDGYADQFGGDEAKKFKSKTLKELLLLIQDKKMEEQHNILAKVFDDWKREYEQIDDVCIIGLRV